MVSNGAPGHSGRSSEGPGGEEPRAEGQRGGSAEEPRAEGQRGGSAEEPRAEGERGGSAEEVLSRLEQRLDAASEAAERLFADAAAHVAGRPPAAGWQRRRTEAGSAAGDGEPPLFGSDTDVLLGLLATVRHRIPPELQQRLADAVREVLLAIRALIDWYLERSDRRAEGAREVKDIPIL